MSSQRQWISTATGASPPRPKVRNVFTSPFRSMTLDRATSPFNSVHSLEGSVVDQSGTHGTVMFHGTTEQQQQRGVLRPLLDNEYLPSPPPSSSTSTSSSSTTTVTPLLGSGISPSSALMSMPTDHDPFRTLMSLAGRTTGPNVLTNTDQRWSAHRPPRRHYYSNSTDVDQVRRGRVYRRRRYFSRTSEVTMNAYPIHRPQEMTVHRLNDTVPNQNNNHGCCYCHNPSY